MEQYIDIGSTSVIGNDRKVFHTSKTLEMKNHHDPFAKDARKFLFTFASSFFYYEFYLLSLLLTMDVYVMVCHPFKYGEFRSVANVAKCLIIGSAVCLLLAISDLIASIFALTYYLHEFAYLSTNESAFLVIAIAKATKITLAKIAYMVCISRMGYRVVSSLAESRRMEGRADNGKRKMYKKLIGFCFLPQVISTLFLVPEIFVLGRGISPQKMDRGCIKSNVFHDDVLVRGLHFSVFTFGTFLYHLAFLGLFPAVRRAFRCKLEPQ